MKLSKNPLLADFAPNLTNIKREIDLILKNIQSDEHKRPLVSIKKHIEKLQGSKS